jgi:hypothetical protein
MWAVVLPRTCRLAMPALALAVFAAVCPGCNDPAHVALQPLGGPCSQPAGATAVKVTAYTASGEHSESVTLDEALAIADFPGDTEQLGVEVLIGGGEIGAAGKSAPLVFGGLADGATIPVFMAPPDGFCAVGPMTAVRAQPLVARAGAGVLVVGGIAGGAPVSTAEYYDPVTAAFSPVEVPSVLADPQGFVGAALATLPDGRVALSGGPQRAFIVFDPAPRAFTTDPTLIDARAFHAAISTADSEVIVAGGCLAVTDQACSGLPRHQLQGYRVNQLSAPDTALPATSDLQVGAQLFDLGMQRDGRRGYLLAGGSVVPAVADRFALDDAMTTELAGGHAQPAVLDGGAVLTAFAADAAPAAGDAAVYAPDAPAARAIKPAPALTGVRLIGLEDGRVAAFGGDPGGAVQLYDPTADAWTASPGAAGPALTSPSLVRLDDGSVLVVGGDGSSQAWLYRPSLVGPAAGSVTAMPVGGVGRGVLTAPDPATVTRGDAPVAWRLTAPADAADPAEVPIEAVTARALVGGPRTPTGSVRAIVHVEQGGAALIAQQTAPGHALIAKLVPGEPPQLVQLDAGAERVVCRGVATLAAFDPVSAVTLRLALTDHDAQLSIDDAVVLSCGLSATDRGAWGIATLGPAAVLAVDSVTVAR